MLNDFKNLVAVIISFFTSWRLLIYSLAPVLFGIILFLLSWSYGLTQLVQLKNWLFVSSHWLSPLFYILSFFIISLVSGLASYILTTVLFGYFLELFILEVFKINNLKPEFEVTYFGSMIRAIFDDLRRLGFILFLTTLMFLFSFFPPFLLVTMGLGAFLLGIEAFDLPLQMLGLTWKSRFELLTKKKMLYLRIGTLFSLILLIPFFNLIAFQLMYMLVVKNLGVDFKYASE